MHIREYLRIKGELTGMSALGFERKSEKSCGLHGISGMNQGHGEQTHGMS